MYNRIIDFLNRFEILYPLQFEFRKNHSTVFSLTYLINKISTSIDQNEITVGVFLDLSKPFNTHDHQIFKTGTLWYPWYSIATHGSKAIFITVNLSNSMRPALLNVLSSVVSLRVQFWVHYFSYFILMTFLIIIPKIWNSLPSTMKRIDSRNLF